MRTVAGILIALVLLVLAALGILLALSPGRPATLRDGAGAPVAGSISERSFVEIGGVRQGMFVQSANPSNPVLLLLHGGPGLPQFFLAEGRTRPGSRSISRSSGGSSAALARPSIPAFPPRA